MYARLALAAWVCAGVLASHAQPAAAQADAHARALARASCQNGKHSATVVDATAAIDREPDEIGPRMRLADALVDQGCYQEAVGVLEAVQDSYPRNAELSAKLRAVRSLVTEQTYIEGLTQAAEGAKLARNQLRCTRLADLEACEEALQSKPDDVPLLLAKGDALLQVNRPADAATAYRHASQLKPGDEAVKTKLTAAEALAATSQPAVSAPTAVASNVQSRAAPRTKVPKKAPVTSAMVAEADGRNAPPANSAPARASQPNGGQHLTAAPTASVASLAPPETKTYSNDAPAGQTN
jgi:cytochrome c-type biogenesis protein CcmH/NrfG